MYGWVSWANLKTKYMYKKLTKINKINVLS